MMKRLLAVAAASVGFAVPALLALGPPRIAASGAEKPPAGVRLVTLTLGRDVGVAEAPQSARILPAAFDVDEAARTIDVLDTVNARIATFDEYGRRVGVVPFVNGSRTVGDLVRMPDGTRYAIDVVRRQVIALRAGRQTIADAPVLAGEPVNARMERHGTNLYVGDEVRPLLGAPAADPEIQPVPDGRSVVIGRARVRFDRPVLDVLEETVDGRGMLWAIVDLDDGTQRLLSVHNDRAAVRPVDAGVFGDVTRRLVALDRGGVVVMSATRTSLVFTRYTEAGR